jgi:hypothetical protein
MTEDLPTRMYEAWITSPDDASTYASMKMVLNVVRPEIESPLRARIAELEAALKPFSLQKLSTEPHTTTLMYYTPIGELERQAREIKKRDDEIRAARAAYLGEKE